MTTTAREGLNLRLLRARDAMDRDYARPLDVPTLARVAYVSPSHFAREFRAVFGEPPHRYLQRRRLERACAALRDTDAPVTQVALDVGFDSLGTFSRTFRDVVGRSPSQYRRDQRLAASSDGRGGDAPPGGDGRAAPAAPACIVAAWTRVSSFGEAPPGAASVA
ncbi:helix-turn-helix domain-containing protein [Cellulomonas sp. S1-8]|uniref:helix-turn-helix domain-containing protein n=1 Tax=Cellulomonas sp. S1-8 TaxID=2904790 RepID=UPI0022438EFE|nr:AraC family transcriptional regulator [Cellulomonas sp. S1-8]UZN02781.1 AraC family transcriptional regulator [Cellulomonas sp. S1-8]